MRAVLGVALILAAFGFGRGSAMAEPKDLRELLGTLLRTDKAAVKEAVCGEQWLSFRPLVRSKGKIRRGSRVFTVRKTDIRRLVYHRGHGFGQLMIGPWEGQTQKKDLYDVSAKAYVEIQACLMSQVSGSP